MAEMNNTTINEAMRWFPFLRDIQIERTHIPLGISLSELDDEFLNQSLLEDESEAAGHFNVKKTLYVARGDKLYRVDVRRSSRRIYPPEYLHPGMEFPDDESGWSETIREALNRQDLTEAQYIVLYTRGSDGYKEQANNILIALVKK